MTPTAALRSALAAYKPGASRWQQQRQYNAVLTAATALADKIAETQIKLEAQWAWLDANPDHLEHDAREEGWLALNDRYEAAYRLLGEAWETLKREGVDP